MKISKKKRTRIEVSLVSLMANKVQKNGIKESYFADSCSQNLDLQFRLRKFLLISENKLSINAKNFLFVCEI